MNHQNTLQSLAPHIAGGEYWFWGESLANSHPETCSQLAAYESIADIDEFQAPFTGVNIATSNQ